MTTIIILAWIASGYAVNAGYFGLMEYLHPDCRGPWDMPCVVVNTLVPPGGAIALLLFWYEHGRQPFIWDWTGLLR